MPIFEIQRPKTQDTIQLKNPVIQIDIPEGYAQHNNPELEDPRTFNQNWYKHREDLVYNWLKNAGTFAKHFVLGVESSPWKENETDGMSREELLKRFHARNTKRENDVKEVNVKEAVRDSVLRDAIVDHFYKYSDLDPTNTKITDAALIDNDLWPSDGIYLPHNDVIIYPWKSDPSNGTRVHERSHSLDNRYWWGTKPLGFPEKLRIIQRDPEDKFMKYYLNSWNEIKARLMEIRYDNKLDPTHQYNIFEIENMRRDPNFKDNELIRRYDNQTLLDLLNNIAQAAPSNPYTNRV